jgi:hypothetical protein
MSDENSVSRRGNPNIYELIEHSPKEGNSPTIWAWPQVIDYFKVAGQPVQGPWPPHQEPRPDPTDESLPVAIPDPQSTLREPARDDGSASDSEPGGGATPY